MSFNIAFLVERHNPISSKWEYLKPDSGNYFYTKRNYKLFSALTISVKHILGYKPCEPVITIYPNFPTDCCNYINEHYRNVLSDTRYFIGSCYLSDLLNVNWDSRVKKETFLLNSKQYAYYKSSGKIKDTICTLEEYIRDGGNYKFIINAEMEDIINTDFETIKSIIENGNDTDEFVTVVTKMLDISYRDFIDDKDFFEVLDKLKKMSINKDDIRIVTYYWKE